MKIPYFTERAYQELFDTVPLNRNNYIKGNDNSWTLSCFSNKNYYKESRIDAFLPDLAKGKSSETELQNTIVLYESLKDKLSPRQASNTRLWSYLTHFRYWDYTIDRWFDNEAPSVDRIKDRMFCDTESGSRTGLLRNAISKLWWEGFLTRVEDSNPYKYTKLLLSNSDLRLSILERKFSMNRNVTIGILSAIYSINEEHDLVVEYEWRELCKYVNRFGAVTLLDVLTVQDIRELSIDYIMKLRS